MKRCGSVAKLFTLATVTSVFWTIIEHFIKTGDINQLNVSLIFLHFHHYFLHFLKTKCLKLFISGNTAYYYVFTFYVDCDNCCYYRKIDNCCNCYNRKILPSNSAKLGPSPPKSLARTFRSVVLMMDSLPAVCTNSLLLNFSGKYRFTSSIDFRKNGGALIK